MTLIDYEYAMWNPEYMDLAKYLCECVVDMVYPGKDTCIAYYHANSPSEAEICEFTKQYFLLAKSLDEQTTSTNWETDADFLAAVKDVKKCMLLNNFFMALAPIILMTDKIETEPAACTS